MQEKYELNHIIDHSLRNHLTTLNKQSDEILAMIKSLTDIVGTLEDRIRKIEEKNFHLSTNLTELKRRTYK